MDDLDFDDEPRRPRFFFLWLFMLRLRLALALAAGAIPAVMLYHLTGCYVVSFIVGALVTIAALVFIVLYGPRY